MSDNFWARKLGAVENTAPAPAYVPTQELYPLYTTPAPQQGTVPSQQMAAPQGQVPEQEYVPSVRLKQGGICPGCGSDTYFSPSPSIMPICGDCGFNPRFEQEGYGAPTLRGDGATPVAASRQVAGTQTMRGAISELMAGRGERIQ
jgi:hypothetical protein